jgi:hypothetical protein
MATPHRGRGRRSDLNAFASSRAMDARWRASIDICPLWARGLFIQEAQGQGPLGFDRVGRHDESSQPVAFDQVGSEQGSGRTRGPWVVRPELWTPRGHWVTSTRRLLPQRPATYIERVSLPTHLGGLRSRSRLLGYRNQMFDETSTLLRSNHRPDLISLRPRRQTKQYRPRRNA